MFEFTCCKSALFLTTTAKVLHNFCKINNCKEPDLKVTKLRTNTVNEHGVL